MNEDSRADTQPDARQTIAYRYPSVDIIICVHNAREHVEACLGSLLERTVLPFRLFIVNDGSEPDVTQFLDEFCASRPQVVYIHNLGARGYTVAANQGLRQTTAEYVVLLNSDTVVTTGWLERLLDCALARPGGGIFGPLSNAAMYQSIPTVKDSDGNWCVNDLPADVDLESYASAIGEVSDPLYPQTRLVNGFCYMISRKALQDVGWLDEESFPQGYGEEDDFSLRAHKAGYALHVVDNCYVFHAKSKSYTDLRRKQILLTTKDTIREKHSAELVTLAVSEIRSNEDLVKARVRAALAGEARARARLHCDPAAISLRLGLLVAAGVPAAARRAVAMTKRLAAGSMQLVSLTPDGIACAWGPEEEAASLDVAAVPRLDLLIAYHDHPEAIDGERLQALVQYAGHGGNVLHLAASRWLAQKLKALAPQFDIAAIVPTPVDTELFRPHSVEVAYDVGFDASLRATDRETVTLLQASVGLRKLALADENEPATELARLVSRCRVFIAGEGSDVSALEAMACGVPVVAEDEGSAADYAQHRVNAFVVKPGDPVAMRAAMIRLITNRAWRRRLIEAGMRTAWAHDLDQTAAVLLDLVDRKLGGRTEPCRTGTPDVAQA